MHRLQCPPSPDVLKPVEATSLAGPSTHPAETPLQRLHQADKRSELGTLPLACLGWDIPGGAGAPSEAVGETLADPGLSAGLFSAVGRLDGIHRSPRTRG
ncbi:hypothetical protein GCM10010390_59400 [Streptomyces mordarskii]|uniref:Uncharacterized protein n=1 Tax=Streptomyces mordarskii TaxID=1226758 RepID=A0ABP3NRD0_9ACTN